MRKTNQEVLSHREQQGVVLIVVLMVVLLLAIAAAIAVRSSQTSLGLTTTAQVNQLLFQSSDVPLTQIREISKDKTKTELEKLTASDMAPIRFLQLEGEQKQAEYVLCYQPTSRNTLYQANQHLILLSANGATKRGLSAGYCNISSDKEEYFTSARKTVATQVSLSRPTATTESADGLATVPFQASNQGVDEASVGGAPAMKVRATVTSVLPTMGNKLSLLKEPKEVVDDCLKLAVGHLAGKTATDNQIACLNATDVPKNIQVQDYVYQSGFD